MAVTGYTPHPATGFVFHRDDGPPMHFAGAEADGLRQWLDASRGPDARVAYDPSAPFGSASSVPDPTSQAPAAPRTAADAGPVGGMSMAPPAAPAMSAAPVPPPPAAPVAAPPGGAMPSPPSARIQSGALDAPAGEGPTLTGPEIAAYALRKRYVPGRAAYDPEADAAQRRAVPISRTVAGGLATTPEEEERRLQDARSLHEANQAALSEIGAASAERTAAAQEAQKNALTAAATAEQEQRATLARRDAVENTWNSTNARLQTERDAAANQQVDPRRLFHGSGGAVTAIGSALAVGLGAFGAGLSGTPNYAQQIVDASIQRDIDSQTDAIHRRGAAAQNAISDFQRAYGLTLDEARSAVKSTQLRYAASMADMNAARIGSADARQNAAVLKADFLQRASVEEAKLAELYKGRVTDQFVMAAPVKGSAGGYRAPTDAEIKAGAEAGGAINKAGGEGKPGIQAQRLQLRMDEDERTRRVALPDGNDAWATSKERADQAQQKINGGEQIKKNLSRMREILSKTGSSLDPELRTEYDALAQRNLSITKEVEGFRTLTDSDQDMMRPLTGEGGQHFLTLKESTLRALQAAEQHVDFRVSEGNQNLYEDPEAKKHLRPTEKKLGIKETAGTVTPSKRARGADEEGGAGESD